MKRVNLCVVALIAVVLVAAMFIYVGCSDKGAENSDGDAVAFLRSFRGGKFCDGIPCDDPIGTTKDTILDRTLNEEYCGNRSICGSFTDARDGKTYKTVRWNYYFSPEQRSKTWMAENLNYETPNGSWCYENNPDNCDKYGRLYDWATAMDTSPSFNNTFLDKRKGWDYPKDVGSQGLCPSGWHLPAYEEFSRTRFSAAATWMKSGTDWVCDSVVGCLVLKDGTKFNGFNVFECNACKGDDEIRFSALPGGSFRYSENRFNDAGYVGTWWTATDREMNATSSSGDSVKTDGTNAPVRRLYANRYDSPWTTEQKRNGVSVRCVKNTL